MTSQQIFAAIDQAINAFMSFCRAVLGPIAILCAFFAGVKMILVIVPSIAWIVPAILVRGDPMPLAATAIACALAAGSR